jgi:hypothetical protein
MRGSDARSRNILPLLAVVGTITVLAARFFELIWKYAVNILYSDQWDFLALFFRQQTSIVKLFLWQHGPHREGLGLLPDKFLYPLTHWNSRGDSFVIGIVIFVAMLFALQLKRKLFGALTYSDVAIPVIFLSLEQYETLLEAPNPAPYAFPLLLIMLYCLALLCRDLLLRYALILLVNFFLIYTGYGLIMGVITLGFFLLECYWSRRGITSVPLAYAVGGFALAAASFASFFIHYRMLPRMGCLETHHLPLWQYLEFMALMFSASVVSNHRYFSAMTVLGVAILLGVIILAGFHLLRLLKPGHSAADLVGAVLLVFCLLFTLSAAVGRLCLGMDEATASRHHTLLMAAYLAIYFYLLSRSWQGKRRLVLALFVLLLLPATLFKPRIEIQQLADHKRAWAECYVRTESIKYCDQEADLVLYPSPERNHMQQKLDFLKQRHLNFFYESGKK